MPAEDSSSSEDLSRFQSVAVTWDRVVEQVRYATLWPYLPRHGQGRCIAEFNLPLQTGPNRQNGKHSTASYTRGHLELCAPGEEPLPAEFQDQVLASSYRPASAFLCTDRTCRKARRAANGSLSSNTDLCCSEHQDQIVNQASKTETA